MWLAEDLTVSPFSRRSPGPLYVAGQLALLVSIGSLQLVTIVGLSAHSLRDAVVAHTKLSGNCSAEGWTRPRR